MEHSHEKSISFWLISLLIPSIVIAVGISFLSRPPHDYGCPSDKVEKREIRLKTDLPGPYAKSNILKPGSSGSNDWEETGFSILIPFNEYEQEIKKTLDFNVTFLEEKRVEAVARGVVDVTKFSPSTYFYFLTRMSKGEATLLDANSNRIPKIYDIVSTSSCGHAHCGEYEINGMLMGQECVVS
ncbi:MAG: hypothetical protein Q7S09_02885 [bacterium]|nr:hypothetical protein [bacterium]